jgi:chromosome segregation ATPase
MDKTNKTLTTAEVRKRLVKEGTELSTLKQENERLKEELIIVRNIKESYVKELKKIDDENESLKREVVDLKEYLDHTINHWKLRESDLKREVREFAEWYSQSDFIYDSFNKRWEDSEGYIKTYEQLRELYKCK